MQSCFSPSVSPSGCSSACSSLYSVLWVDSKSRLTGTGPKDYRLSGAGGSGRNTRDKATLCKDT